MPSATPLSRQSQLAASGTENLIDDEPQLITSTTGNSVMLYSAWPEPIRTVRAQFVSNEDGQQTDSGHKVLSRRYI